MVVATKALEDIVSDEDFWNDLEADILPDFEKLFATMYAAGVSAALVLTSEKSLGLKVDLNELMGDIGEERAVRLAAMEFWQQYEASTRRQMLNAFLAGRANGETPALIAQRLEGIFSRSRAEEIAITESTRLFGMGAQATYRALGYSEWEWTTVEDPAVEGRCRQLNGKKFPMTQRFQPAHPRCRCYPIAVPETRATAAQLGPEVDELLAAARAADDEMTAIIKGVAEKNNAKLYGLDFRFKGKARTLEKMDESKGLTAAERADSISDSLRYTYHFDDAEYARGVEAAIQDLSDQGVTILKVKNYWETPTYRGINVATKTPSGHRAEVQFHTPASQRSKDLNHDLYAEQRSTTDGKRIAQLEKELTGNSGKVPTPPNAKRIGELVT